MISVSWTVRPRWPASLIYKRPWGLYRDNIMVGPYPTEALAVAACPAECQVKPMLTAEEVREAAARSPLRKMYERRRRLE